MLSFPSPPVIKSSPPLPINLSFPPSPQIRSLREEPRSLSFPAKSACTIPSRVNAEPENSSKHISPEPVISTADTNPAGSSKIRAIATIVKIVRCLLLIVIVILIWYYNLWYYFNYSRNSIRIICSKESIQVI